MPDDRELWTKICAGEPDAFDGFYREHAPRLQAFLRRIVGDPQAAEDVAQETFTQIWNRPNGFKPELGTLRAYLYGIGRKRAAEWWRKQTPRELPRERSANHLDSEMASVIANALDQLPEEQRTLLWLREVEGQSYAELALILGVPIGTVRSRLFAAREAMRAIWRIMPPRSKEDV